MLRIESAHLFLFVIVGIPIAFFILLIGVSYFEKRLVNPFIEIDPTTPDGRPSHAVSLPSVSATSLEYARDTVTASVDPNIPPLAHLSDYTVTMTEAALAAGFSFGSMLAHRRYPAFKVTGTVLLSPDRRSLLLTWSGTMSAMPFSHTSLVSPRADNTWLITTDTNDEGDPAGIDHVQRRLNQPFADLYNVHVGRVNTDPLAVPWPPGRSFDLLVHRARTKSETLLARGFARRRNHHNNTNSELWSYNVLPSLTVVLRFGKQFIQAIPQRKQVERGQPLSVALTQPAAPLVANWRKVHCP